MTQITSLQALPLVDGCPPDIAQIPQELQPNLITAAVAMGLQHAPVIEPGSGRLAHRWAWSINVWPLVLQCLLDGLPHFPSSKVVHLPLSPSREGCSSALPRHEQSVDGAVCHPSTTPHQCVLPLKCLNTTHCHAGMWLWLS